MNCLTITLNAAIDATYVVERFAHGGTNRVLRTHAMPGGKGNNVARTLAGYGHTVVASGFLGGSAGAKIEAGLREARVNPRFAWLKDGESRSCHTVLEADTGVATEVLEGGPVVTEHDAEELLHLLPELVAEADITVISGSAPQGMAPAFLKRLASLLREGSGRFVVDSSGVSLESLMEGRPDLIKPNEHELQALIGYPASRDEQIGFVRSGIIGQRLAPEGRVMVSLGAEGALLVTAARTLLARAPTINPVNTVGCGDALLAGFLAGWADGLSDEESLAQAVSWGTAAALQEVAGVVDDRDVQRLRPDVDVCVYGYATR